MRLICGDAIEAMGTLPDASVRCCVTSPPYYALRDYGVDGQIGLESTPAAFIERLVAVFREVRRVLTPDGTVFINMGDSYAGSGKGGNPEDSPHKKQRTNNGSMSMVGQTARDAAWTRGEGDDRRFGFKPKDRMGIPHMLVFALRADGWYWRDEIVWHKPNPMPESTRDRCTKAHEFIFMLSKSARYYYDAEAIKEPATADRPDMATKGLIRTGLAYLGQEGVQDNSVKTPGKRRGGGASFGKQNHDANGTLAQSRQYDRPEYLMRNKRSVWTVVPEKFAGAHFATFPPKLIEPCILAGSAVGDTVLDPFAGSGTTLAVAMEHGRNAIGIELNPKYVDLARRRLRTVTPALPGATT